MWGLLQISVLFWPSLKQKCILLKGMTCVNGLFYCPNILYDTFTPNSHNIQVGGPGLKLPSEKLEDMMGEHNMLIKRMLSSLAGKDTDQQPYLKDTDQAGFEELIKSLVASPTNAGLVYC